MGGEDGARDSTIAHLPLDSRCPNESSQALNIGPDGLAENTGAWKSYGNRTSHEGDELIFKNSSEEGLLIY